MSCFEAPMVSGYSRVPDPPARMMPLRVKMEPCASAVPAAAIRRVQELMRPGDDLAQVERLLEDGAGVVLQPGAHVLRLGVTAHDGDPADQHALEHPPQGGLVFDNQNRGRRAWRRRLRRRRAHDAVACAWRGGTKPWAMRSSAWRGSRVSRISPAVRPR